MRWYLLQFSQVCLHTYIPAREAGITEQWLTLRVMRKTTFRKGLGTVGTKLGCGLAIWPHGGALSPSAATAWAGPGAEVWLGRLRSAYTTGSFEHSQIKQLGLITKSLLPWLLFNSQGSHKKWYDSLLLSYNGLCFMRTSDKYTNIQVSSPSSYKHILRPQRKILGILQA